MAYNLISEIKPFIEKVKNVEVENEAEGSDKESVLMLIAQNVMVKFPEDTARLLSKLWVLEEADFPVLDKDGEPLKNNNGDPITERRMEEPPNVFETMAAIMTSKAAIDFFASALPSLLQISKSILPRSK
jgi:hypothetical protein